MNRMTRAAIEALDGPQRIAVWSSMKRFKRNWKCCAVWDDDDVVQAGITSVLGARDKKFRRTAQRVAYLKVCAYRGMRKLGFTGLAVHFDSHSAVPSNAKNSVHLSGVTEPGNNRDFEIENAQQKQDNEKLEHLVEYAASILTKVQRQSIGEHYGVLGYPKITKTRSDHASMTEGNRRHKATMRAIARMQSYFVDGILASANPSPYSAYVFERGQRFGPLKITGPDKRKQRHAFWRCRCDCGRTVSVRASSIAKPLKYCSVSCGLRIDDLRRKYAGRRVTNQCL